MNRGDTEKADKKSRVGSKKENEKKEIIIKIKKKMKMVIVDYNYAYDDKRGQEEQKMHLKFTDQEAIRSIERKIEIV